MGHPRAGEAPELRGGPLACVQLPGRVCPASVESCTWQAARRWCTVGLQLGRIGGKANKSGPLLPSLSTDLAQDALPLQRPWYTWRTAAGERHLLSSSLPRVAWLRPQPARTAKENKDSQHALTDSPLSALHLCYLIYSAEYPPTPCVAAALCIPSGRSSPGRRLRSGFRTLPALLRFLRSFLFVIGKYLFSKRGCGGECYYKD